MTKGNPLGGGPVSQHEMGLFCFREFDDKEPLAKAISEGFDLRTITQEDRDIIADLVRSGTRRPGYGYTAKGRDGEMIPRFRRDLEVCSRYACLLGIGVKHPAPKVAKEFGLTSRRVRDIWRDYNFLSPQAIEDLGKSAQEFQVVAEFRHRIHEAIDHESVYGALNPVLKLDGFVHGYRDKLGKLKPHLRGTLNNACAEKHWVVEEGEMGLIARPEKK